MRIYTIKMKRVLAVLSALVVLSSTIMLVSLSRQRKQDSMEVFSGQPERDLPIYSVDTKERKIAISFDAAWGADKTERIMDILDDYGIKTTFFLVGFWVDKYPDHVKMIVDRGHEIGNHTTTHPHMSKLSAEQMKLELKTTTDKIESITGQKVELFRPPYGDYSNTLVGTARAEGYYTIQWSVELMHIKIKAIPSKAMPAGNGFLNA